MKEITELCVVVRRIWTTSYVARESGIGFQRMLAFEAMERVTTDRLLVSEEAVRALDLKE